MLSLKNNLPGGGTTTSSFPHHPRRTVSPTMPASLPNDTVMDDGNAADQSDLTCNSCESLVDSLSSNTTACSSMNSGNSNSSSLMKKRSMRSSFALTSLLQQRPEVGKSTSNSHSSLNVQDVVPTTLADAIVADAIIANPMSPADFGLSLQPALGDGSDTHDNRDLRQALEVPLRQARAMRDSCRRASALLDGNGASASPTNPSSKTQLPLSSWVGLPYAGLREERPFLYDHMHTHPLSQLLSKALGVGDLHQLHQGWNPNVESAKDHQRRLFAPLLNRRQRQIFQQAYESFVTSCCIPLLHAAALRGNVFNSSNRQHHSVSNDPVVYRYQVFPTINVVYPNDLQACQPPTCDLSQGKSVGWLHFHVPLTASRGTSALYCEHFPGREDWHALRCTQVGLGYCWDGARCLSFVPLNTTGQTRVSLDFRILLVRTSTATLPRSMPQLDRRVVDDDTLCRPHHLQDALTRISGFYREATMDTVGARTCAPTGGTVAPDARCGFPFA